MHAFLRLMAILTLWIRQLRILWSLHLVYLIVYPKRKSIPQTTPFAHRQVLRSMYLALILSWRSLIGGMRTSDHAITRDIILAHEAPPNKPASPSSPQSPSILNTSAPLSKLNPNAVAFDFDVSDIVSGGLGKRHTICLRKPTRSSELRFAFETSPDKSLDPGRAQTESKDRCTVDDSIAIITKFQHAM
jgi:hypothetical protein